MRYALIENGIVENVIALEPRSAGSFPNAVLIDDIPAAIGDTYDGEHFYHDGEVLISTAEKIADMQNALETLGVTIDG